ncbi:hypothetical protein [Vitiosangium sp. GDMCC 1.1324]|uniref:hypothetical protein n=1 Tax=Vitiosangium sp. (strain GDMCC 1.1324) TaxID=2138576 RepID=UPI000D35FBBC|nr:hypothetical protein [Vitiosangium sp. GDMCC 1.1324]PTL81133.1 hypothetical protein DAT35_23690 [Vitiosangium sp. GDMCC 1.1324]
MGSYLAVLAAVPYFGSRPLIATTAALLLAAFGAFETDAGAPPQFLATGVIGTLFVAWSAQRFVWGHVEAVWPHLSPWRWRAAVATATVSGMVFAGYRVGAFASSAERPASALLLGGVVVGAMGALTLVFARAHTRIRQGLEAIPGVDELGVLMVLEAGELLFVIGGIALCTFAPTIAALAVLPIIGMVTWAWFILRAREESERIACPACATSTHRAALRCPGCGALREPSALDVIGRTTRTPAADTQAHVFALLARCRCRACAEPLKAGGPEACCARCGARAFPTPDDIRVFLRAADRALMRILPLLALIGAVPVIGLVAGLCVLRLSSASAVAAHGRWKHRLVARAVRVGLMMAFSLLQVVPFVGAAVVPLIAVASHLSNRRPLLHAASTADAAPVEPVPPAPA